MGYSKDEILKKCQDAFRDVKTFYKQSFINYNGITTDTNEYYTEVVAEFLCENIAAYVNGIPQITRKVSYKTIGHNGIFDIDTPREEEKIAMEMFKQSQQGKPYHCIGTIIDYQTPLKNERSDIAGKIDLLSFDGSTLHILELKKPDSEESMLRCVLEGFTYMQTVNKNKLLNDFNLPFDTMIKASPFVFYGKRQYKEMLQHRPYLSKLMTLLDSEPFYIIQDKQYRVVEG